MPLFNLFGIGHGLGILGLPYLAFTIWLLIDCANNRREIYWYWIIFGLWGIGPLIYFFTFKWNGISGDSPLFGWFNSRRNAAIVKARVRNLDNADSYEELGDNYSKMKKLPEAEAAYREAIKRDPKLVDARAKLAEILVGLGRADEAWPSIEEILKVQRDYHTDEILRQAARCQMALGKFAEADAFYQEFLGKHSYFEAHLEYGEALVRSGRASEGREQFEEVIEDIRTSPPYVRRRNWRESMRARWLLFRCKG